MFGFVDYQKFVSNAEKLRRAEENEAVSKV
jgi:hypothetical protein